MGQKQAKEKLFYAIERGKVEEMLAILQVIHIQFPDIIDQPMWASDSVPPISRVSWRGNVQLLLNLLELGADINNADSSGITPLMWAAKRDHSDICAILIQKKADYLRRSKDGYTALDYAILHGNYSAAYIIFEFDQNLQNVEDYYKQCDFKKWRYVDYEKFLNCLQQKTNIGEVPNFYQKPKKNPLCDPVPDPTESWQKMASRILNFEDPPMVERHSLPENLQPQNRFWGKVRCYVNGQDPNDVKSSGEYQAHQSTYNQS